MASGPCAFECRRRRHPRDHAPDRLVQDLRDKPKVIQVAGRRGLQFEKCPDVDQSCAERNNHSWPKGSLRTSLHAYAKAVSRVYFFAAALKASFLRLMTEN